jgi:hypothetical protein
MIMPTLRFPARPRTEKSQLDTDIHGGWIESDGRMLFATGEAAIIVPARCRQARKEPAAQVRRLRSSSNES